MPLLIAFALAWAIVGACHEIASEARAGAARTRDKYRHAATRRAAEIRRRGWKHPSRWALAAGTSSVVVARATGRGSVRASRAAVRGWRQGWADGKERYRQRQATREGHSQYGQDSERVSPRPKPQTYDSTNGDSQGTRHITDVEVTEEIDRMRDAPGNGHRTAQPADTNPGSRTGASNPKNEGSTTMTMPATMNGSGEAPNIESAREALRAIVATAEQATSTIDNLSASLANADMDAETLSDVAEILDAASELKEAADQALTGMDSRHSAIEEAVNAAPHVAETSFYRR